MKLIVPMAGRGTRVRPHSHVTPKPLLSVRGKSVVERIVELFARVLPEAPDEGVFVLGPDFGAEIREQLTAICDRHGMKAHFVVQKKAEGTAHAVAQADGHLRGDGIVVFADTLFDMEEGVELEDADVIAWVKEVEDPRRFGIAVRDGERVTQLIEKPSDPVSNEALIGIYYVKELADLHRHIKALIEDDQRGKGGEFQLTDAFDRMLQDGSVFKTATATEWLDCGTIPALLDTTKRILDKENAQHGGEIDGSIIHEPVYIGPDAKISDSVIGPYASIEAGAEVRDAVVKESILFSGARVENSVLTDSLVGQHAEVRRVAGTVNIGDHSELGER